jgi:hypothetical protein
MGHANLAERSARPRFARIVNVPHGKAKLAMLKFRRCLTTFRPLRVLAELTLGGWAIILILTAFLISAIAVAYFGWMSAPDTVVPTFGYVALILGSAFSLVVGAGLMWLVFYSSRHDYDEPPKYVLDDTDPKA